MKGNLRNCKLLPVNAYDAGIVQIATRFGVKFHLKEDFQPATGPASRLLIAFFTVEPAMNFGSYLAQVLSVFGRTGFLVSLHTTGHFCFTQRRHARNALIIKGNQYQSLRALRRCVENVQ
jgi:hypothetical protein